MNLGHFILFGQNRILGLAYGLLCICRSLSPSTHVYVKAFHVPSWISSRNILYRTKHTNLLPPSLCLLLLYSFWCFFSGHLWRMSFRAKDWTKSFIPTGQILIPEICQCCIAFLILFHPVFCVSKSMTVFLWTSILRFPSCFFPGIVSLGAIPLSSWVSMLCQMCVCVSLKYLCD